MRFCLYRDAVLALTYTPMSSALLDVKHTHCHALIHLAHTAQDRPQDMIHLGSRFTWLYLILSGAMQVARRRAGAPSGARRCSSAARWRRARAGRR